MRKVWKWLALLVVVAGAVAGGMYWRSRTGTKAATTTTTQIVTAQRGNLTASISPTGGVYAPHTAALGFEVTKVQLIELDVAAGQEVKEGDVLARIDPASLERAVEQAQADLASAQESLTELQSPATELDQQKATLAVTQAETTLEQAKESLAELKDPDLPAAERAVRQAIFSLESAKLNLTIAQFGTTVGKAVRDAKYSVAWHERNLRDLKSQLALGKAKQDDVDEEETALAEARGLLVDTQNAASTALDNAQFNLKRAGESLTSAKADLADLQVGPTALELSQGEDAVAVAEYDLAKAKQDLADLTAGPDTGQVQLAQSKVAAAQATLDDAEATLASATMVAPFDGTIVSVGAEVGDLVSSGTSVVTMADLSQLRVLASIDETEISQVQVGQDVEITFDAFTGYTFKGKVLEVPLEGSVSQSIVTYKVPISLEGTEAVDIKSGMTANLTIVTGQVADALLIPTLAVQQGDSGDVVLVPDASGASTTETPVEVGLSNGTYTQVVRGLNEGDKVVVVYDTSNNTTGFGFGRQSSGILGGGILGGGEIRIRP
jgi:HlyD family secretion protein